MNPKQTAFLFPGQGSQALGMGAELAAVYSTAQEVFSKADELLGFPLSDLAWNGPESKLNDTVNTQPALLTHSVAAWQVFREQYPEFQPAFVAGHSMGEVSALVASAALPFDAALILARRRGELMQQAGEIAPGGMAAIIGLDLPTLDEICQTASSPDEIVQVANDNCPGQVVISGHTAALERAMAAAQAHKARKVLKLAVSIAAHSPLMAHAQADFNLAVEAAGLQEPQIPIIGNVTAQPLNSAAAIQADLNAQLNARVRWTETITYLLSQGIDTFIEIGSGAVLSGLVKRIERKTTRQSLGIPEDMIQLQNHWDS